MTESNDASGSTAGLRAYPNFVRLLVSRIFGGGAMQMMFVAVAWQMYDLTGSAWDLGLVGLYQFAPVLVFTLYAGHLADKFHRARIVSIAVTLQLVVAG